MLVFCTMSLSCALLSTCRPPLCAFCVLAVALPAQPPAVTHSSSSEDEAGQSGSTVIRRRRLRKNTTSIATEPEEEEEEEAALETGQSEEEEEEDEGQRAEQTDVGADALVGVRREKGQSSSILNSCILIALIVAFSMSFGHFHGKFFTDVGVNYVDCT